MPIDSCPGTYAVDDSLRVGWDIGGMAGDNLRVLDREWLPEDYPDAPALWRAEEQTRAGRMIWRVQWCQTPAPPDAYSLHVSFADYYTVDFGTNCNGIRPLMEVLNVFRAARPAGVAPTPPRYPSRYRTGGVTLNLTTTEAEDGGLTVEGTLADAADGGPLRFGGVDLLGTTDGRPPPTGVEVVFDAPGRPEVPVGSWFRMTGLRDGDVVEIGAEPPDYDYYTRTRFVVSGDRSLR